MDYEKKYKEALDRAKNFKEGITDRKLEQGENIMDYIFPELKESDDERIRKWLIKTNQDVPDGSLLWDDIDKSEVLAWLEKQGKKPSWSEEDELMRKEAMNIIWQYDFICRRNGDKCWTANQVINWLENQGKQKEINLVEILKHYPRETELYSPLYGKLWLAEVDEENEIITCYKDPLNEGCTRAMLEQENTVAFYSNGTTGLPDCNVSEDCMLFLYDLEKQGKQNVLKNERPEWVV